MSNEVRNDLQLGVIGNGTIAALIDERGRIAWGCFPALDGDPAFCELLSPKRDGGYWAIEIEDFERAEQHYITNTAVLVTVLHDRHGGCIEIADFAPRYHEYGRLFHPSMLMRRITVRSGTPRIRVVVKPLRNCGAEEPERTSGSNHVRYLLQDGTMRLTSDLAVPFIDRGLPFVVEHPMHLVFGPDETLTRDVSRFVRDALESTIDFWQDWVRVLSIPFEWQQAVIRAAITLKLCQYEATGGVVAALTTSIPEAPDTERNWDYRYCWLRDAAFVVRALNGLGATDTMEGYTRFVFNLAVTSEEEIAPVFGITYEHELTEKIVDTLAGYRGMGPVRIGNLAWKQRQNDIYGSILLATSQLFFDSRLVARGDRQAFERLESLGERAARLADQPDASLWEFRGRAAIHTYSSAMCWAACDRLARIARHLGLEDRQHYWHRQAERIRTLIDERGFNDKLGHFVAAFDGETLDASLLRLADFGFVDGNDPRYVATVEAVSNELLRGDYLLRYSTADDFGKPSTSFTICTFWYIEALVACGRREEARELFENVLARRNPLGLLSEDIDPANGELWGNFPQTYSMVGIVQAAARLSRRWEDLL